MKQRNHNTTTLIACLATISLLFPAAIAAAPNSAFVPPAPMHFTLTVPTDGYWSLTIDRDGNVKAAAEPAVGFETEVFSGCLTEAVLIPSCSQRAQLPNQHTLIWYGSWRGVAATLLEPGSATIGLYWTDSAGSDVYGFDYTCSWDGPYAFGGDPSVTADLVLQTFTEDEFDAGITCIARIFGDPNAPIAGIRVVGRLNAQAGSMVFGVVHPYL